MYETIYFCLSSALYGFVFLNTFKALAYFGLTAPAIAIVVAVTPPAVAVE